MKGIDWQGAAAVLVSAALLAPQANAQTLRIAVGPDRYTTDDNRYTYTLRGPHAQIAEPPVRPDAAFMPQGLLFESWQVAPGGRYRVKLKAGLRFHDGTALNADAVMAELQRIGRSKADLLQIDPASWRRIDALNFEFRSATGSMLVIENLSHRMVSVISPASDRKTAPAGSGPYRFERYEPRKLLAVRADLAYRGIKPLNERIVFRFMPDAQTRLLALLNGEVDLVADVPPQLLLGLTPNTPVTLHTSRPVMYAALLVNAHGQAPYTKLADVRLRRAIALAIDRTAIAKVLYNGRGVSARALMPDWMFGLGPHTQGHDFDPAAAERLLDEAGWRRPGAGAVRQREGQTLNLRLVAAFPSVSAVAPMPEMLQQMLRQVGIAIDIVGVDDDNLYTDRYLGLGQGDLFLELASNTNLDPTFLLYNLFHSKTPWTYYRWMAAGPALDAALDEARATADPKQRLEAVRRAERVVVDEAVTAIPVLLVPQFVLTRPGTEVTMFEHRDWIDYGAVRLASRPPR